VVIVKDSAVTKLKKFYVPFGNWHKP